MTGANREQSTRAPSSDGRIEQGAVSVRNASRRFRVVQERNLTLKETLLRRRRVRAVEKLALQGVSFDVSPGEALGIVGRNGSGKSTLLKLIAGTLPPHGGEIEAGGRLSSLLELGAGFHPDFSGRENVYINGSIHGLSEREVDERLDDIIDFSEIRDYIEMPVRTYSSGMYMRLAFAIASHIDPDVLLLDEVLAVGDEAFQGKCLGRMYEYRRRGGTLLFVSHDANAVEQICDRAIMLDDGRVVEDGPPQQVLATYHRLLARGGGRLGGASEGEAPVTSTPEPTPEPVAADPPAEPQAAAEEEAKAPEEEPAAAESSGSWGSGAMRITAYRTLGPDGETSRFVGGDPMTIEMEVTPTRPIELPVFGITIHSVTGELCFGTHTGIDEVPTEPVESVTRVRFEIPRLNLQQGRFLVTLAASESGEVCHWLDRCLEFSVYARAPGVGLVDMSGDWTIAPSGETSGRRRDPVAPGRGVR